MKIISPEATEPCATSPTEYHFIEDPHTAKIPPCKISSTEYQAQSWNLDANKPSFIVGEMASLKKKRNPRTRKKSTLQDEQMSGLMGGFMFERPTFSGVPENDRKKNVDKNFMGMVEHIVSYIYV